MSARASRQPCPVLTCTRDMAIDSTMCTHCLVSLPTYQRVALEGASKAVRRQPTKANKERLTRAIANAITTAAGVRS